MVKEGVLRGRDEVVSRLKLEVSMEGEIASQNQAASYSLLILSLFSAIKKSQRSK
jgi:hypothetical protein